MRYFFLAILVASCGAATDPKVYEESAELIEEIIKDEVSSK
jgi:hypothetical protein